MGRQGRTYSLERHLVTDSHWQDCSSPWSCWRTWLGRVSGKNLADDFVLGWGASGCLEGTCHGPWTKASTECLLVSLWGVTVRSRVLRYKSTPEEPTKVGAGLKTATLPWVLSGKGRCQWANCFDINRPCRVRAYSAISCPRQIRDGVVNHGLK